MNEVKQSSKKTDRGVRISCTLSIINCIVWFVVGGILFMFDFGGVLSIYIGDHAALLIFIGGFICAFAPLYLIFIKKKFIRFLSAYLIVAVFIVCIAVSMQAAENFAKDFTKEKWLEYPQVRGSMVDDLKKNHGIIGMDAEGVIDLLGTPDGKNETVFSYYADRKNRTHIFIEVRFSEGKVQSVEYINMI